MSRTVENEYRPNYAVPPGQTLLETIETFGMSQAELAERMGRPRKTINEIIKGKAALTPETALQLERVLGMPASFWSNYEGLYRQALARLEEAQALAGEVRLLEQMPVREMVKLGWIRGWEDQIDQLREVLQFFAVASPAQWRKRWEVEQQAALRSSPAFQSAKGAISAWLRKGEIEAQRIDCAPYDPDKFKKALRHIRALTREPQPTAWARLVSLCAQSGVAVVVVPELPGRTHVSGATRWLSADKALIQLSFRYKTDDQVWFTFFHEAGHILLHGKRDVFIEEGADGEREKQADEFALNLLLPPAKFRKFVPVRAGRGYSKSAIESFADQIGIAPGIVVGRLQHGGLLPYTHCNGLKRPFALAIQEPGSSN